jgi:hypothetical protein
MKTEIGKYYVVYDGQKLILDLGLHETPVMLQTLKSIFVTENEQEYNDFLDTLETEGQDVI